MSAFSLYLIGMIIVIAGLACAAFMLHVSARWIIVGAIVLPGAGIIGAANHAHRPDRPRS